MSPIRRQFPFRRHNISVNGERRSKGLASTSCRASTLREPCLRIRFSRPSQPGSPSITPRDSPGPAGPPSGECAERGIPVQEDGRRKLVPLERVVVATTGKTWTDSGDDSPGQPLSLMRHPQFGSGRRVCGKLLSRSSIACWRRNNGRRLPRRSSSFSCRSATRSVRATSRSARARL